MKKLYIFLLIFSFSITVVGQRRSIKKADEYFEINYFSESITYYEEAEADRNIGEDLAHVTRRLAEANYNIFDYRKSLYWYQNLFGMNTKLSEEDYYNYGAVLRIAGYYEKAKEKFFQYANLVGDEDLKEYYKNLSDWSETNKKEAPIEVFNTDVSIGDRSLGVAYYGDGLLYSETKTDFSGEVTPFYNLVYAETDEEIFESSKKLVGFHNNEFFNGGAFFDKTDSTLYFTSNASDRKKYRSISPGDYLSKEGVNNLRIYSTKFENGEFQKRKDLKINNNNFSNAHPSLTKNGDTLYFASNRKGGVGGYDLYRSVKKGDKWTTAENLGPKVNTDQNEMFPFVLGNKLYFASYGHLNYGGSDIFESLIGEDGSISKPENLGKPYNSTVDDFGLIMNSLKADGYFSSNRNDTSGYDRIYYYKKAPADTVNAIAKTRFNLEPVDSVKIDLYQVVGDDESLAMTGLTDTAGTLPIVLEKGKEYKAYFIKEGYKPDSIAKVIPKTNRKDIVALFDSAPIPGAAKEIKNIYFEFDKWNILEESKPVLDQLYYYMKEYPEINVFIGAHTDCIGTELYNYKLSDKRAESTIEYLIQKGVHPDRLTWKGYGKSQLKVKCGECLKCTSEQHQQNRRVTFEIKVPGQEEESESSVEEETEIQIEENEE
ncbi:MAG: OmpA family protein [Bacteroidota bacterium]